MTLPHDMQEAGIHALYEDYADLKTRYLEFLAAKVVLSEEDARL